MSDSRSLRSLLSLLPSPYRVGALASVTFTQLVRMRLFVVLAVLVVGFLLLQFIPYHGSLGVEYSGIGQLELIKNIAMGCMQLFGVIFCVAATALLIPRDAEDRILYTILCKPVPRLDYLLGKMLGVLALMGLMLLVMDGLMSAVLLWREQLLASQIVEVLSQRGMTSEQIAPYLQQLSEAGATMNVQRALLLSFMGWAVLTSMCLLISCFTSGTIVSMVLSLGFYFVGTFQSQFFDALALGSGELGVSSLLQSCSHVFSLLVPDFSLYTAADLASSGVMLSWGRLGGIGLITMAYCAFHLLIATWLFSKKEF